MKKTVYVYERLQKIEEYTEEKPSLCEVGYVFIGTREIEIDEPAPEKKREPIEAYANVYKSDIGLYLSKSDADEHCLEYRFECVRLVECPEGSAVVGFAEFRKAWNTAFSNYTKDTFIMDADGSAGFKDLAELLGIKKAGK